MLHNFTSYVDSRGKTVIVSNCPIAVGYLNKFRTGVSSSKLIAFPNGSGGLNVVTAKIDTLVDTYVNKSAEMYDIMMLLFKK